ncbi:hypothetical protein ACWEGV_31050, partial [Streptomyces sp. NPDC004976]
MVPDDEGGGLMRADLLTDVVDGLDEALAAVDGFDGALVDGLLRPRPAQAVDAAPAPRGGPPSPGGPRARPGGRGGA